MNEASPTNDSLLAVPDVAVGADDASVVASLLSIAKSTRAFLTLLLAEIDLHPGQDQLLARLEMGRPISVSALADQLAVRPSTVSKMLDRLIEKRLVERASADGDARRTMVLLTPSGQEMCKAVHALWGRLEAEIVGAMPPGEDGRLGTALAQVDTILSARLRRRR